LREGWQVKRLGDFAEAVSTGPFGSLLHKSDYVNDGVPLVNPVNIIEDQIVPDPTKLIDAATKRRLDAYALKEGDIVVGRRGEIGRCAVVGRAESGWVCGTGSFFIRPLPSIDSQFLAYLIRSNDYREKLEMASTGTTMRNLSNMALGNLAIAVPPLHEQQRIVGVLDEAFKGIAGVKSNAEKSLQNTRAVFESHLQAVFAAAWETSEVVPLSNLAAEITDGDHMPPPKAPTGVPFITIGNIIKNTRTIDFSDTYAVPHAYFDRLKDNKKPREGDLLYTVTGSFGIPVIVEHGAPFCFQRHIALIRPKPETNSSWLCYLLLSPQVFGQATARATGTAQRTVSLTVLRTISVPAVKPAEQRATAAHLDVLEAESQRLESLYEQKIEALDELKKSLLHQAFTGQL
jgi:type I restriction enzyme, S subunit